jgi:membrane-bound lytic murein transglycosylase B
MILRGLVAVALIGVLAMSAQAQPRRTAKATEFEQFLAELWKDAQAKGVTRDVFNKAFTGVTPDPRVIATTKRQPEYNKPAGRYVNDIASPQRVADGLRKELEWREVFEPVEKKYQVERWMILAIWGMETSYGALKDKWDGIRSLATLAFAEYRHPYFRSELLVALKIIQEGHIAREKFVSSWAGAMGQTQFMPSNFVDYAVDYNGDGRRDIWTNVPDVLASTANYFVKAGWKWKVPWGFEVTVPRDFDLMKSRAPFGEWAKLGVLRADGRPYPATGDGILFFPTGYPGPAFIVTANFDVIKDYNDSDVYALAIGHLADRMQGAGPIKAAWPKHATQLPRDDRIELQRRLAELGYDQNRFTAHIDFKMRDFVRAEQKKHGLVTDGHPNRVLLQKMGLVR